MGDDGVWNNNHSPRLFGRRALLKLSKSLNPMHLSHLGFVSSFQFFQSIFFSFDLAPYRDPASPWEGGRDGAVGKGVEGRGRGEQGAVVS